MGIQPAHSVEESRENKYSPTLIYYFNAIIAHYIQFYITTYYISYSYMVTI